MNDFDRWEGRFAATRDYVFGTAPNAFLERQSGRLKPGAKALSVADGEGRNGVWLAGQGLTVTSQDFSPTAQGKARALAAERGVELTFELSDLTRRAWEADCYDVIVGIFFQFLSPDDRTQVFGSIRRAIRPGGLILIEGYGPRQLGYGTGGPKILENLYTPAVLAEAFGDFSEVHLDAYDTEVSEGAGHSGMSSLVDLVAVR